MGNEYSKSIERIDVSDRNLMIHDASVWDYSTLI